MKIFKHLLFYILTTIIGFQTIKSQNMVWAKQMGGTQLESGTSVVVDSFGNVYSTGHFMGTADFDPGAGNYILSPVNYSDVFISKLDALGNFVWAKKIGGLDSDIAYSICLDSSGNIFIAGSFAGTVDFDPGVGIHNVTSNGSADVFILKLDTYGNFIWAKTFGGSNLDRGNSISVDLSGNIYTTGHFWFTVDFDPGVGTYNLTSNGLEDVFILKLDSSGNFLWAKKFGGTSSDLNSTLKVDAAGNIYTSGVFNGTVDFNPGPAVYNLVSAGYEDVFISKLDSLGNFVWAKRLGGIYSDWVYFLNIDKYGNVYTTGSFSGTSDFDPGVGTYNLISAGNTPDIFISKLDTFGNFLWAKHMGNLGGDLGVSLTIDTDNYVYVCGNFEETVDFDPGVGTFNLTSLGGVDAFITKFDSLGNFVWAKQFGGISHVQAVSLDVDIFGNIYTTGNFISTADFDPSLAVYNLTSFGSMDIFVHKMNQTTIPTGTGNNNFIPSAVVFPNPTNGKFSINLKTICSNPKVVVRNIIGQEIQFSSFSQASTIEILIEDKPGVYFIEIINEGKMTIARVVKE